MLHQSNARLAVSDELAVSHPLEIFGDEREDEHVVGEHSPVAQVPEVGLIQSVAALSHVDRLEPLVEALEEFAPGLVVRYAVTEREGVARADHSEPTIGNLVAEVAFAAQPLGVRLQVDPLPVHVFDAQVRNVRPSQLGVVGGVADLSERAGRWRIGIEYQPRKAREPLEQQQADRIGRDQECDASFDLRGPAHAFRPWRQSARGKKLKMNGASRGLFIDGSRSTLSLPAPRKSHSRGGGGLSSVIRTRAARFRVRRNRSEIENCGGLTGCSGRSGSSRTRGPTRDLHPAGRAWAPFLRRSYRARADSCRM